MPKPIEKLTRFISSFVLSFILLIGLLFSLILKPRGFWGLIRQWVAIGSQQV